jgi:hypothetical protein
MPALERTVMNARHPEQAAATTTPGTRSQAKPPAAAAEMPGGVDENWPRSLHGLGKGMKYPRASEDTEGATSPGDETK